MRRVYVRNLGQRTYLRNQSVSPLTIPAYIDWIFINAPARIYSCRTVQLRRKPQGKHFIANEIYRNSDARHSFGTRRGSDIFSGTAALKCDSRCTPHSSIFTHLLDALFLVLKYK